MYEKLTIRAVKLTKSKKGDNFVVVEGVTDGGVWVKDWIGINAPAVIIIRWWKSCGIEEGEWCAFHTAQAFALIGKEVLVKLKDGDYGMDVEEVRSLDYVEKTQEKPAKTDTNKPMNPVPDDIPF